MSRLLVVLFVVLPSSLCKFNAMQEWSEFKIMHKKTYSSLVEEHIRMNIFLQNKNYIEDHNSKHNAGNITYKLKMNHFGDKTPIEIKTLMNGYNRTPVGKIFGKIFEAPYNVELPQTVDWREKGAVTPVKNQGLCGCCWSFSSTGALEGQYFLKTGKLVSLSEQNLIDCTISYGNRGCHGGQPHISFQYISDNGGIATEDLYPFEGEQKSCRYNSSQRGATDIGFYMIFPPGNEKLLKFAVATVGPISVSIDASHQSFHFYSEGVYVEPECNEINLNHVVLVVGYGTEHGKDYWLVKNSWGIKWGESGYIKMARNEKNNCGIATDAVYPFV